MTEETKESNTNTCIKDKSVWVRLLYMLLFTFLYSVAELVIVAVVIYQFLSMLLTGKKDQRVAALGSQLSAYVYQALQFLTFNSEVKPFPMADWPAAKILIEEVETPEKQKRAPRKPATRKPTTRKTPAKKAAPKAKEDKPTEDDSAKG